MSTKAEHYFRYTDLAQSTFTREKLSAHDALKCFSVQSPHGITYSNSACQDAAL